MIDLIKSTLSITKDISPDDTIEEAGIDAIDRALLAMTLEDEYGVVLSDCKVQGWQYVGDIMATVEKVS